MEKVVELTDIAKLPSSVRCKAPPKRLLHNVTSEWEVDGKEESGNLRKKAIVENDMEAFVKICDMYKFLHAEEELDEDVLKQILQWDRVEMLDEYIRRTGSGIDVKATRKEGEVEPPVEPKKKLYLGLTVHGKKRADLARKHDPDAVDNDQLSAPLLWRAASVGARTIVEYLAGERPLAAYRYYSVTHSDAFASRIRASSDLETILPKWIGWDVDILNESPFTAAIFGDNLDLVKTMFKKQPQLMKSCLHNRCDWSLYLILRCSSWHLN
jgi:hypothetical protein